MKKLLLLNLMLSTFNSFANNWDLFPLNQKSIYYALQYPNSYHVVLTDTSYTSGSMNVYLNRWHLNNSFTDTCFFYLFTVDPFECFYDTLFVSNDTVTYRNYYNQSIYFLPKAQLNDSWTVNGYTQITFTCTSVGTDTVLGITDSIKTFSIQEASPSSPPLASHTIRLSKTYGLVDFVNFNDYLNHVNGNIFNTYILVGLSDINQTVGFTQPSYSSYLPYSAGDVLIWNLHFDNGSNWSLTPYDDYYKDSLTSVATYADSVVIIFDQTYLSHTSPIPAFYSSVKKVFYTAYEGVLLSSPPNSKVLTLDYPASIYKTSWMTDNMYTMPDTVVGGDQVERYFTSYGDQVASASCYLLQTLDYFHSLRFNDHLGLIEDCEGFNVSTTCKKLIAGTLNGHVYGNPVLPLGVDDFSLTSQVRVYPVPAKSFIHFNFNSSETMTLKIFTELGSEVLSVKNYHSNEQVDLSNLTCGIYFASLIDGTKRYFTKIIH